MSDAGELDVRIPLSGDSAINATLAMPARALGVILFAHGSENSHVRVLDRHVAGVVRAAQLGTLLLDLLTTAEDAFELRTSQLRFDVDLLAARLLRVADWVREEHPGLPIGYFGASTGGAAALIAAGQRPELVDAMVACGGLPDLARGWVDSVTAPTLLVVGPLDVQVLGQNRMALSHLPGYCRLSIIPGVTQLFEEEGALDEVARQAAAWFTEHLIATVGR